MVTETDGDVESWADLVGPFYDAGSVAVVLGVSMSAVYARTRRGSLLGLRTGNGATVYPVFQFDGDRVEPRLARVLRALRGASGWTLAAWLRSPEVELGGRTPMQALTDKEDDLVLLVASHAAAGWAQ
jgi:hypothetical protein